jgi:hypothetical protein
MAQVDTIQLEPMPQPAEAQSPSPRPKPQMVPLEATIIHSQYLPPEMYGQWTLTATLMESNTPNFFNPVIHEIWMLEQTGETVTISNPSTGASASITVDKVQGNTATFHRAQMSPRRNERVIEIPTVTVEGDHLRGTTINQVEIYKNGKLAQSFYAKYALTAERINNSRVRFGQTAAPPVFEIEKIRRQ